MVTEPAGDEAPGLAPRLVETHSALLVFIGDRVYKLKKPVDLGFLDFRTPAARKAACAAEVELNSRLSPDVYLGVCDVYAPGGEVCESLVTMRRMPEQRRLSTLVAGDPEGPALAGALAELGRLMAAFHSRCPTSAQIAASAGPAALRRLWVENVTALARYAPKLLDAEEIDRIRHLALTYLDGREPLLRRRQQQGHIRDGHGDLMADDIFVLDDGPRVLDCLEFDARLRFGDVVNDVAFLAMDLERLGAPRAARRFLDAYARFSGEHHPSSLEHHYIAYRAGIRAKVACLRWDQGDKPSAHEAQAFSALAVRHLQRAQVALVLVGGLPGTGKSTVAAELSNLQDGGPWLVLRSDAVRKELAGLEPDVPAAADYGAGLYQPHLRRAVYTELMRRAELALGLGQGVIIDATFAAADDRAAAGLLASRTNSALVELECRAPACVVADRLDTRTGAAAQASDAGVDVFLAMAREQAPWPSAQTIDTSTSIDASLEAARGAIASVLGYAVEPRPSPEIAD